MPDAPLKVLFFTYSLGGGGAEMHLLRLVNHLDRTRIAPVVAVARTGGAYEHKLLGDVPLHHLGASHVRSSNLGLLSAGPALRALLVRVEPDVVCGVLEAPTILLQLVCKTLSTKVPCVSLVQNALSELYLPRRSLVREAIFHLMCTTYPSLDRIVAISDGVARDVVEVMPGTRRLVERVYNAVVETRREATALRSAEGLGRGDGYRIVACGRLVPQKDYPSLLRAIAQARRHVRVRLAILGAGPLERELRALAASLGIAEHVDFLGFVDDPARHMAAADVFVLSSRHEGFGNVLVEAMASGTPVVATACPHGPEEIIEHEESGLLVPVGDPDGLAQAILRVLSDSSLRQKLVRGGARRAQAFSADKIAAQYAAVFECLVARTPPAPRCAL